MEKKLNKFRSALKSAIEQPNAHEIGRLVEFMRCRLRMDYQHSFDLAHELTGIELNDWDDLLYEWDSS